MIERQKSHNPSPAKPRWFWPVAAALSLAVVTIFFSDPTLTVQADTPQVRPPSTLHSAPPQAGFLPPAPQAARSFIPAEALHGIATWYGSVLNGHHTASGERFDEFAMTAAHKTLPFGTLLRVINLKTHKSIVVRVNDRGILPENRVIDLSYGAAKKLEIVRAGIAPVKLEILSLGHPGPQDAAEIAMAGSNSR